MAHDPFDPLAAPRPTATVPPGGPGASWAPNGADPTSSVFHDLPPSVGPDVPGDGGEGRGMRWVLEWALVILVAAGVAIGMRTYVVGTYFIPSASMEPTLMIGDRILVNKLAYHYHSVQRGDIVVFARPPDEPPSDLIKDLVKRVIGLPGETIASGPHAEILIDGRPIAQPWLTPSARLSPGPPITANIPGCSRGPDNSCLIPSGQYFVMGDNRGNSDDSRYFGTIPGSLIVGHVVLRFWPLRTFHVF